LAPIACLGQANVVVRVEYGQGIAIVFTLATRNEIIESVTAIWSRATVTTSLDNNLLSILVAGLEILCQPFKLGIVHYVCQIVDLLGSSIQVELSLIANSIVYLAVDADVRVGGVDESSSYSNILINVVGTADHVSLGDRRVFCRWPDALMSGRSRRVGELDSGLASG